MLVLPFFQWKMLPRTGVVDWTNAQAGNWNTAMTLQTNIKIILISIVSLFVLNVIDCFPIAINDSLNKNEFNIPIPYTSV